MCIFQAIIAIRFVLLQAQVNAERQKLIIAEKPGIQFFN